jgi:hypothetical protein
MVAEWIDQSPSIQRYRELRPVSHGHSMTAYAVAAGVLGQPV